MRWEWRIGECYHLLDQRLFVSHNMNSDCSEKNLLMDASSLYPNGHHPVNLDFSFDLKTTVDPLHRSKHTVRYYYVDFGISTYFPSTSASTLVTGIFGRNQNVPELSDTVPYDPFKVDIFSMGQVFEELFIKVSMRAYPRI